ncbi:MAG: hypothetical protein AAF242_06295 [Bacteroidota bacterium]
MATIEERVGKGIDQVKGGIHKTNQYIIDNTDKTVDKALEVSENWQDILAKALKKGASIWAKNQEIFFDTLDEMKVQHNERIANFKKLVNYKTPTAQIKEAKPLAEKIEKVKTKTTKAVKEVKEEVSEVVEKAQEIVENKITDIKGIGPKLEGILKEAGIVNIQDIVDTPVEKIKEILVAAGGRYKALDPQFWVDQAKEILK